MTSSHHLTETNNRKQTSACHSAQASQKPTINEVTKGLQDNEITDYHISWLLFHFLKYKILEEILENPE